MSLVGAARRVTRNFDQFSVICVFGSVVGCVVLPLMVQSMESFIITFLLLCITAKPLKVHLFPSGGNQGTQDSEKRRSREKEDKRSKKPIKKKPVQVVENLEAVYRHREEDLRRQEQQKLIDKERRMEEKREKKAKKKEERLQRKEEERKEKEKEDQIRREKQEMRKLKKKVDKDKKVTLSGVHLPTYETIQTMVNDMKPLKRERKYSNSSSASSVSAHSITYLRSNSTHYHHSTQTRHSRYSGPFRASSDPEISISNNSQSSKRTWQTLSLPASQAPSHWQHPDVVNRAYPNLVTPPYNTPVSSSTFNQQQDNYFQQQQHQQRQQSSHYTYPPTRVMSGPLSNATTNGSRNSISWSGHSSPSSSYTTSNINCSSSSSSREQRKVGASEYYYQDPQCAWLRSDSNSAGDHDVTTISSLTGSRAVSSSSTTQFSLAPGTAIGSRDYHQPPHGTPIVYGVNPVMGLCGGQILNPNLNCYTLFSRGGESEMGPFMNNGGGLLSLDMTHVNRLTLSSTSSPLSVSSDGSTPDNNSTGLSSPISVQPQQYNDGVFLQDSCHNDGAGIAAENIGKQSPHVAALADSADTGEKFDEWPNL